MKNGLQKLARGRKSKRPNDEILSNGFIAGSNAVFPMVNDSHLFFTQFS